jgi:hypothetical protein
MVLVAGDRGAQLGHRAAAGTKMRKRTKAPHRRPLRERAAFEVKLVYDPHPLPKPPQRNTRNHQAFRSEDGWEELITLHP